ncbi:MAG TPA: ketopantoate reductase family protein [Bacteroidetes bacterium]|nr:ketopantoate reductase family protein [Bacteroidota bacterium]
MDLKEKSILVVGAGSIGGITAAFLKNAGYNVEIVCKYEEYRDIIISEGIAVSGVKGAVREKMNAYINIKDTGSKKDIILLAVKATDMVEAAEDLKSLLKENSLLVSMQNGICEPELGRILGNDHIVGCIVGWGATMDKPGELLMTSGGDFVIGYIDRPEDERLAEIAELLGTIHPVRISANMMGHLFSKLIINACITSLGAITGLLLGEMMRRRKARKLFIAIIREAVELAHVLQIKIEDYGKRLNYYDFVDDNKTFAELRRHIKLRLMGLKYRKLKSSSLQSLQRGKLTEIDYLNGYIATYGREYGVPTPVNEAIVKMIHEIEDSKRKISPINLDEEVFQKYYK